VSTYGLTAFDEVRLRYRRPTGRYLTPFADKATRFPSYDNAILFSFNGFIPEHMPDGQWSLRDITGDYIESLIGWWEHTPQAEASFNRAYRSSLKRFLEREHGFIDA
jgi:hypothetical protein